MAWLRELLGLEAAEKLNEEIKNQGTVPVRRRDRYVERIVHGGVTGTTSPDRPITPEKDFRARQRIEEEEAARAERDRNAAKSRAGNGWFRTEQPSDPKDPKR